MATIPAQPAKKAEPQAKPEEVVELPADSPAEPETGKPPSVEERLGMRGHEDGNVRPADGRYGLHQPKDESKVVRKVPRKGRP